MLHRDVFVFQLFRPLLGLHQKPGKPLRNVHLSRLDTRPCNPDAARKLFLQFADEAFRVDAHAGEQARNKPFRLFGEREQKMLAVHLRMPVGYGFILCVRESFP